MKLRKSYYFIASMIIFSIVILSSSFLKPNDESKKTKVIINYNNKIITEDIENLSEVRVSTSGSNLESGIIILPVIDANKEFILDAL